MSENGAQEKTEQATEKRLREAREKGQIARSKELTHFIVMLTGILLITWHIKINFISYMHIFKQGMSVELAAIFDHQQMLVLLAGMLKEGALVTMPVLLGLLLVAIVASIIMGGVVFSSDAISFKLDRLNFLSGLAKIFSAKTAVELVKAILKFCVLALACYFVVKSQLFKVLIIDKVNVNQGILLSLSCVHKSVYMVALPLVIIVLIDVPYQIWSIGSQLKMTKQELKDEMKDTEGKPEVKSKIRQLQNQIRRRRMMANVPKANVIITNPEHFAVALQYDEKTMPTPVVVAKGADLICEMIKKVANSHKIPIVRIPELARSLYYVVELEEPIPQGLYLAVAKVLAYVMELKRYQQGLRSYPSLPKEVVIPEELRRS